jgi:hypothetical protein
MKMKKIVSFAALSFILATGVSQADIHVSSSKKSLKTGQDACDQFVGAWDGDGYISASLPWYEGGDMSCHYNGGSGGGVTVSFVSGDTPYLVHVDVSEASGSDFRCPSSETVDLHATCNDGTINISESEANLNGQLSADGTVADIKGTLEISGHDANVDSMHLVKK